MAELIDAAMVARERHGGDREQLIKAMSGIAVQMEHHGAKVHSAELGDGKLVRGAVVIKYPGVLYDLTRCGWRR